MAGQAGGDPGDFRAKVRRIGERVDGMSTHGWFGAGGAWGQALPNATEEATAIKAATVLRQYIARETPWVVLETDRGNAGATKLHPNHAQAGSFDKLVQAYYPNAWHALADFDGEVGAAAQSVYWTGALQGACCCWVQRACHC